MDFEAEERMLEEEENVYTECGERQEVDEKGDIEEEDDYSEPVDRLQPLYSSPGEETLEERRIRQQRMEANWSARKQRFSEGSLAYEQRKDGHEEDQPKRKLSLGLMIRRLSRGMMTGGERKNSDAGMERRSSRKEDQLSSVIGRLVAGPKSLGGSHQVDSSSWEFLNTCDGDSASSSRTSTGPRPEDSPLIELKPLVQKSISDSDSEYTR